MRSNRSPIRRLRSVLRVAATSAALGMPCAGLAQTPPTPGAPLDKPAKADQIVEQLVEGHNKERAKEGLPPLKLDPMLVEAAKVHARDMADHEFMSHDGSDGSTSRQRIVNAGYHYQKVGENVAVGYLGVADVIQGWMDSPPHKKNILDDFTEIGVARVVGKDRRSYWCADFGTPMKPLDPAEASADLVKRINDERSAAKLTSLTVDDVLAKAARERATSLAKKKSQGGEAPSLDGIDQKLYRDLALSTANGHPDAPSMVKALLERPDLKSQILGKYARIGTGYATADDGVPYWCVILANPARRSSNRSEGR